MITYEYPFNERIRTLLRLEDLFEKTGYFAQSDGQLEHHTALVTLFEILEVAGRADLKMDLIQELERQRQTLLAYRNNPDISEEALSLARENAKSNETDIAFYQGNLLAAIPKEKRLDGLVSNPPYIPLSEKENLQKEVRDFDPALALFGGEDGLQLVRELLQQTENRLESLAPILIEIGSGQEIKLQAEATQYPWLKWVASHKDYYGNVRFVEFQVR